MSTRRFFLHNLIFAPALSGSSQSGTAVVIRLSDRRVLHMDNPDFASGALLPPASTIKPFVIYSLLAAGKVRPDDLFYCPRRLQIVGHQLNCVHPQTPLPMNAARALAYSCNGALAHFALRFAPGELAEALMQFGFTSLKRMTVGAACQLQALGEEGISVTPMQLLRAYARLAAHSSQPVLEGLEGAVEYGTAQAAQVPGVQVAGKTGSIVLGSGSPAAWFAGFAPSREPRLAVVVLTAGRSGGSDAAPIGASLLKRYL